MLAAQPRSCPRPAGTGESRDTPSSSLSCFRLEKWEKDPGQKDLTWPTDGPLRNKVEKRSASEPGWLPAEASSVLPYPMNLGFNLASLRF